MRTFIPSVKSRIVLAQDLIFTIGQQKIYASTDGYELNKGVYSRNAKCKGLSKLKMKM